MVIANTLFQRHKRRLYIWTSPDGQHQNQIDYILCSQRWRSSIQWAKTRLGADCGSDHELLTVKFRLKLKKVEKTTRPFRYNINQIPYDYTVAVRNRFKGLDLIECLMNYAWRFVTLYRTQGSRPSPWERSRKINFDCLLRIPVFSLDSTSEQIRSHILAVEILCDLVLLIFVISRKRSLEWIYTGKNISYFCLSNKNDVFRD